MAARETVEDIDGLAEYITYHHDETDAPAATLAEPEPEPEPQPQPEPRGTDHAEAVASAAGQLRRFSSASAFTRQDEEQIAAAARRILAVTGDAEGRRGVVEAGVPARCIPLLKHFCAAVTEAAVEADRAAPVPPALPPLLKCLRNLCAGSPPTQELLWQQDAPAAALALARRLIAPLDSGVPAWLIGDSAEAVECACLAVQLLGNSIAGHEVNATKAWGLLFPDGFSALLRPPLPAVRTFTPALPPHDLALRWPTCMGQGLRKPPQLSLVGCTAMVLQTCLAKSADGPALRRQLGSSTDGAALLSRLTEHMVAANADDISEEDKDGTGTQVDAAAYDWLGTIIAGHCAAGAAAATFAALGQGEPAVSWDGLVSAEQLRWLDVICATVSTPACSAAAAAHVAEFLAAQLFPEALLGTAESAGVLFAEATAGSALEAVHVAVNTMGTLLAENSERGLLSGARRAALGAHAAALLGAAGPPPVPPASTTATAEIGSRLPRGFKSQLLRLIGNAAFRHKATQDAIHERSGVALCLAHTVVDEHNPCAAPPPPLVLTKLGPLICSLSRAGTAASGGCWRCGTCARATTRSSSSSVRCRRRELPLSPLTTRPCARWAWRSEWRARSLC